MPTRCKEKQKVYQKRWYEKNKETHRKNVRANTLAYRQKAKDWRSEYLKEHPCVDCGETDEVVLDFDHVKGEKAFNISEGVYRCLSIEKLKEEAAKCEIRCANCHRRVTHSRRLDP